eukprot:TRINITY_DN7659_c0_g1_i1.p1 TRINITY_DN7659_c0_g1~~TRINITY_DN7659_c0_g1_i1.p1  ORF type:complete len:104 (-),score=36.58 TRINITY_DN7659_c0_g1_i1:186-497(-)
MKSESSSRFLQFKVASPESIRRIREHSIRINRILSFLDSISLLGDQREIFCQVLEGNKIINKNLKKKYLRKKARDEGMRALHLPSSLSSPPHFLLRNAKKREE